MLRVLTNLVFLAMVASMITGYILNRKGKQESPLAKVCENTKTVSIISLLVLILLDATCSRMV